LSVGENIYITGNVSELGNWNPAEVILEKVSVSSWQKSILFKRGTALEFKFTKGSWNTEALNPDSTMPGNSVLKVEHDTTIKVSITNWRDISIVKIKGQITGRVEYHRNFTLEELKPRDIIVWLPPGYDKTKSKRYPVLYMHDGQNIFDPNTSSMLIDWRIDEIADSLIREKEIKPIIVVGIYNTEDRGPEYTDTQLGHLYMKGIVEKIKPYIDSKYKTLRDRKNTAVCGASLGGLISIMCAWEYPHVFSKAACFSPAFKIYDIDYVKNVLKYSSKKKDITFYIYNGGIDLEERLQPGVHAMINALKQKGFKEGKNLFVDIEKSAKHNEADWSRKVWRLLKIFFGK
jgi:enterochelin esterase-like enzyme